MHITVDTTKICSFGKEKDNFFCEDCEQKIVWKCLCLLDEEITPLFVHCVAHDEQHIVERSAIVIPEKDLSEFSSKQKSKIVYHEKCRHYNIPFNVSEKVSVYASSNHTRKVNAPTPDYGLYLDPSWNSFGPNNHINWPDMDIPMSKVHAAYAIIDAYKKAQEGYWVEVGCIGGHGRTGTALACMAILGGFTAEQAIKKVHTEYCKKAIETSGQTWYIKWFEAFINGGVTEPKIEWDYKKKKKYVDCESETFEGFNWQSFNWHTKTTPPDDIQNTKLEVGFSIHTHVKGKSKVINVYPESEKFPEVVEAFLEQENEKQNVN